MALRGPGGQFHLLPRFMAEAMHFSPEQQKRLAELEKETKARLDKILTPEQKKILDETRPPDAEMGPPPPLGFPPSAVRRMTACADVLPCGPRRA